MAYDPEARSQSNSAMIIGVVALVLLVGGALAYFSTRNNEPDIVATTTAPVDRTVVVTEPQPVAPSAPVVIEKEAPVVINPPVTRTVEKNTTITRDRVVTPATPPARQSGTQTETNVTVNVPPSGSGGTGAAGGTGGSTQPNQTTAQPQAGSDPAELPPPAVQ